MLPFETKRDEQKVDHEGNFGFGFAVAALGSGIVWLALVLLGWVLWRR